MSAAKIVQIRLTVMGPRGVNAFLVCGSRPVIVDTGIPGSARQILEALELHGYAPQDVAMIVITHAHIDHAGDAWTLRQATSAPVVAQVLDASGIAAGLSAPVKGRTAAAQAMVDQLGGAMTPPFRGVEVDLVVEDEYPLDGMGVPGKLVHTPGHTAGGLALITEGEAVVGDIIGADPADPAVAAPGLFATDTPAMMSSIQRVMDHAPRRVYCGHDGPFEAKGLESLGHL